MVYFCIFHQTSDKKIQLFRRKLPTRRVASILEKPVSDLGGDFFSRSAKGGISQPLPPACFQAETGWTLENIIISIPWNDLSNKFQKDFIQMLGIVEKTKTSE